MRAIYAGRSEPHQRMMIYSSSNLSKTGIVRSGYPPETSRRRIISKADWEAESLKSSRLRGW